MNSENELCMKHEIYQVDAFTSRIFSGNPATVVILDNWISENTMCEIAIENNQAETAFIVEIGKNEFEIRWFTPVTEVDLCGHATLAAAYILYFEKNADSNTLKFHSQKSGELVVKRDDDVITLNFPSDVYEKVAITEELSCCFNIKPIEVYKGKTDYMMVYANYAEISALIPDLPEIAKLKCRGVITTARGIEVDFVSRFFAPQSGINEDSVTGSAHVTLTPYWAQRLDKIDLTAKQLSTRRGYLECTLLGNRVEISGRARLYMKGNIFVDE